MTEKINPTKLVWDLAPNEYSHEIVTDGSKSIFRDGVVYHHPGQVPLLEVQGTYFEMGLQYGVLLHRELSHNLAGMERILNWLAKRENVPVDTLLDTFMAQSALIMQRLPDRYIDELKGIAEGTKLPLEQTAFLSLFYDVLMSKRCTGVLMRTANGGVVHARTNDTAGFGGEELGKITLVVRYKTPGCHTVTHIDFPLFMGVETGYNDQGLTFSEETLSVVKPNPDGFSLTYLIRMILEECGNLDELPAYFDRYGVIGAYGTVWSDRRAGRGMVAELTPWGWDRIDLDGSLLWNFNHLYSDSLKGQQSPQRNMYQDPDREAIASTFPGKETYTVEDALNFISQQMGPDGEDYSHCGLRNAICNKGATQAVVFDPETFDFYLGVGVYYPARQNIYRIFDDFSKPPVLYRSAIAMKPVVVEVARIFNLLLDNAGYRDAFIDLSEKYLDDPQVHFLVAYYSFLCCTLKEHAQYAYTAFQLAPAIYDYQLFAGLAGFQTGDFVYAIRVLEALQLNAIDSRHEPLRLYTLEKCWSNIDASRSKQYHNQLVQFLEEYGADQYFEQSWRSLLDGI